MNCPLARLKHQELLCRVESLIGQQLPPGYKLDWDPNDVAWAIFHESHVVIFVEFAGRVIRYI
jgi:hypothetical protein